jgi:shikimate dehydrogenase
MFPNIDDCIHLPFDALGDDHLVVDLIYNPEKTLLLRKAEEKGAAILNGASMLKEQALAAYKIWNE